MPTTVPLLDLKAQYQAISGEIHEAIARVVDSQMFILGPEVTTMENSIADYCGSKHCIGVSSGTDALLVALMALDVGPGDEVITTSYSFFATAGCVARLGAKPVFVDIDPATYNIDPSQIASKVTSRTKAIMPVHLYGQCADMDPILEIAERYGLHVIEDAAQAIGAEYHGKRAGSIGTIGCFSFFPSKNLGAFGDAGAVTTNDTALDEKIRILRMHGMSPKYYHKMIGGNFRIDALQCAILSVKLKYLDNWTASRQMNAKYYTAALGAHGVAGRWVTTPPASQDRHIFNQYIVRCNDRDALQAHLKSCNVGTEIYYPVPLHLQECFAYLGYQRGDLPRSEAAAESTLALPIYPELSMPQKEAVVDAVASHYHSAAQQPLRRAA